MREPMPKNSYGRRNTTHATIFFGVLSLACFTPTTTRNNCRFFRTIQDQPRDLLGPMHQWLVMHCLSEAGPSQEIPEFNQLREDLEAQMQQWLLFECKLKGRSQLAAEMEFPEPILEVVLQEESEDIKRKILNSLAARPRFSRTIMELTASWLADNVSLDLKIAALNIFKRLHEALPLEILQAV